MYWRDGRVVNCDGLENRRGHTSGGSNPSLSAFINNLLIYYICYDEKSLHTFEES